MNRQKQNQSNQLMGQRQPAVQKEESILACRLQSYFLAALAMLVLLLSPAAARAHRHGGVLQQRGADRGSKPVEKRCGQAELQRISDGRG